MIRGYNALEEKRREEKRREEKRREGNFLSSQLCYTHKTEYLQLNSRT